MRSITMRPAPECVGGMSGAVECLFTLSGGPRDRANMLVVPTAFPRFGTAARGRHAAHAGPASSDAS